LLWVQNFFFFNIFGPMPFFSFSAHDHCILSLCTQQHCYDVSKNLLPWRDTNPGLLFPRRMRWQGCKISINAHSGLGGNFLFSPKKVLLLVQNCTCTCLRYVDIYVCIQHLPWRRGIVVIASAYRTEDPGFESRQGARFFRNLYIAVLLSHIT
jgi:hypothetical protein